MAGIRHVDGFVAVSEYYAEFMCGYLGIPKSKMHIVPLGVNFDRVLRPARSAFKVGYLARIAPEKGLHVLAQAYIHLRRQTDFMGTLQAAGYLAPEHHPYLRDIENQLRQAG